MEQAQQNQTQQATGESVAETMARETVEMIPELAGALDGLCVNLAAHPKVTDWDRQFDQLMHGLETLNEAVQAIRHFRGLGPQPRVEALETELEAVLKDLFYATQNGYTELGRSVLQKDLPAVLAVWRVDCQALLAAPAP